MEFMRKVDISKLSSNECGGIQIAGTSHCTSINCKFQGLTACTGLNIIKTGKNSKGIAIGINGMEDINSIGNSKTTMEEK
jgi:hypothetical protein